MGEREGLGASLFPWRKKKPRGGEWLIDPVARISHQPRESEETATCCPCRITQECQEGERDYTYVYTIYRVSQQQDEMIRARKQRMQRT